MRRKERICSRCGQKLSKGDKFCEKCGTPVQDQTNSVPWKKIGIVAGIVFLIILIIGLIAPDQAQTYELEADEMGKILYDHEIAKKHYGDTYIVHGYYFNDDKEDGTSKESDLHTLYSDMENVYLTVFKTEDESKLKDLGMGSEVIITGVLNDDDGLDILYVDQIEVKKKNKIDQSSNDADEESQKEKKETQSSDDTEKAKKEKKETQSSNNNTEKEKKEAKESPSKDDVVEGSTITVDELLNDPEKYAGKKMKIKGMLPQALFMTSDGREIPVIYDDTLQKWVEIKGGTPNFGGCAGIVTGTIILDNGVPIINASAYESIGSTYSATTNNPMGDNDAYDFTTYIVNYDMAVRRSYSLDEPKVGSLKTGDIVDIIDIKGGEYGSIWGKIGPDAWVCIEDRDYNYLSEY
ncbi:zinc ribbon domain-containing protein [Erysipelotrichaceae bacterium 66-17]